MISKYSAATTKYSAVLTGMRSIRQFDYMSQDNFISGPVDVVKVIWNRKNIRIDPCETPLQQQNTDGPEQGRMWMISY